MSFCTNTVNDQSPQQQLEGFPGHKDAFERISVKFVSFLLESEFHERDDKYHRLEITADVDGFYFKDRAQKEPSDISRHIS